MHWVYVYRNGQGAPDQAQRRPYDISLAPVTGLLRVRWAAPGSGLNLYAEGARRSTENLDTYMSRLQLPADIAFSLQVFPAPGGSI